MIDLSYKDRVAISYAIRVTQKYFGWARKDKHGMYELENRILPNFVENQELVIRPLYSFETCYTGAPENLVGRRAVFLRAGDNGDAIIRVAGEDKDRHAPFHWLRPLTVEDMPLSEIYEQA